jgi:hypothetical protein
MSRFQNLLVVIKQTAYEEYTQVRCVVCHIEAVMSLLACIDQSLPGVSFRSLSSLIYVHVFCIHAVAKATWPSAQGAALETLGTTVQGSQAVCH